MTGLRLIVLGGAIVLAGCTSNGGGGGSLFSATAGGLATTANVAPGGVVEVEAAEGATTAHRIGG